MTLKELVNFIIDEKLIINNIIKIIWQIKTKSIIE